MVQFALKVSLSFQTCWFTPVGWILSYTCKFSGGFLEIYSKHLCVTAQKCHLHQKQRTHCVTGALLMSPSSSSPFDAFRLFTPPPLLSPLSLFPSLLTHARTRAHTHALAPAMGTPPFSGAAQLYKSPSVEVGNQGAATCRAQTDPRAEERQVFDSTHRPQLLLLLRENTCSSDFYLETQQSLLTVRLHIFYFVIIIIWMLGFGFNSLSSERICRLMIFCAVWLHCLYLY